MDWPYLQRVVDELAQDVRNLVEMTVDVLLVVAEDVRRRRDVDRVLGGGHIRRGANGIRHEIPRRVVPAETDVDPSASGKRSAVEERVLCIPVREAETARLQSTLVTSRHLLLH